MSKAFSGWDKFDKEHYGKLLNNNMRFQSFMHKETETRWYTFSDDKAMVCIPVLNFDLLNDEKIGKIARSLVESAKEQLKVDLKSNNEFNRITSNSNKKQEINERNNKGFVYLIWCSTNHYKIGVSQKPDERIKVFQTEMPVEIKKIYTFEADNPYEAEKALHIKYSSKRVNGEWFNLDEKDVNEIQGIFCYEDGKFIWK